jgi:hypothetical protein
MYRPAGEANMADLEFDDFEGGYAAPNADARLEKVRRMVNLSGAVCSVALVIGLGFWGYRLAVRDVTGVPVMRAMAGAMRVAPADPGGDQASNQGLSVNAVAATGSSAPSADQITLAPRPVELQPGDTDVAGSVIQSDDGAPQPVGLTISGQATAGSEGGMLTASALEMPPLEEGMAPLIDAETGEVVDADPEIPRRSLRPQPRPTALSDASVVSNVETVAAPGPTPGPATEVDPASLTAGTRLAQLGAFDTPDLAREKFSALQVQFGELMSGKAMVIQSAQSGGRSFYRLRAHGFDGDDEARRFCAVLQADDADCIPVAQR